MDAIWNKEAIDDILKSVHVDPDTGHTISINASYLLGLHLQNFQSIGYPGATIPLRPLTFQYGPNSSGKSTIADALMLLRCLCDIKPEHDPEHLLARWASHHRHRHSAVDECAVRLSTVAFMTADTLSSWARDAQAAWLDVDWVRAERWNIFGKFGPIDRSQFFRVDYEFQDVDESIGPTYLSKVSVATLDGPIAVVRVAGKCYSRKVMLEVFYKHPLFHKRLSDPFDDSVPATLIDRRTTGGGAAEFLRKGLASVFGERAKDDGTSIVVTEIPFESHLSIGPRFWSDHVFSFDEEGCHHRDYDEMARYLDFIFGATAYAIKDAARNMLIPPIRPIPSAEKATYLVNCKSGYVEYDGSDCWKAIAESIEDDLKIDGEVVQVTMGAVLADFEETSARQPFTGKGVEVLEYVNRMLSNPQFLGAGYEVKATVTKRHVKEEDVQNIWEWAKRGYLEGIAGAFSTGPCEVHIHLMTSDGKTVEIEDVGTGISQVVPILVGCFFARQLHVQQPELHLHPKLQAQMADIFIERINASRIDGVPRHFLIETHSEHLLLRVLRRIRETTRSHIPNRLFNLRPEEVAVLYFDQDADGVTTVKHLRISDKGEFIDRWPKGFFTEREADLFDEDE